MPKLTNFSACSMTRVFCESSRRVSALWIFGSISTPFDSVGSYLAPSSPILDSCMDQQRCPLCVFLEKCMSDIFPLY